MLISISCGFAATPDGRLFHLERSKNRNVVCYDVNVTNGTLDAKNPVKVYWIRVEEGGIKKDLSYLQRKLAYGYKVIAHKNNESTVILNAYDKMPVKICKRKGRWIAAISINGKEVKISKLYVKSKPNNSLRVEYVEIFGNYTSSGAHVSKRIVKK